LEADPLKYGEAEEGGKNRFLMSVLPDQRIVRAGHGRMLTKQQGPERGNSNLPERASGKCHAAVRGIKLRTRCSVLKKSESVA